MSSSSAADRGGVCRRSFLKSSSVAAAAAAGIGPSLVSSSLRADGHGATYRFEGPDSLYHGEGWESLNPGYWSIQNNALRRRLSNFGDRARSTGFPYHYETHGRNGGVMDVDYDPSLPTGILYRKDWWLEGAYSIEASFVYQGTNIEEHQRPGDSPDWKGYQEGYGLMGLAIGAKSVFESYTKVRNAIVVGWMDDGSIGLSGGGVGKAREKADLIRLSSLRAEAGDRIDMSVQVEPVNESRVRLMASVSVAGRRPVTLEAGLPARSVAGYFGIAGRGLADFEVTQVSVNPQENRRRKVGEMDCIVCYPLGDTLELVDGSWQVRFVGLFASDGEAAEIRVSDQEHPEGGWKSVPPAGRAAIVNHEWRRLTATIPVTLPANPAESTLYYTVWKDGKNVTSDTRLGTRAVGEGTGYVGDVPNQGGYVGRLPQLKAPYKLCGLSCHALTSGLQTPAEDGEGFQMIGGGNVWQFRDQPTLGAYRHLEDYGFQIMCWEDDVWYMELILYPPSTDDAYKVVHMTLGGPTTRWQMMRHWNIINPGDHDYGMDDVKGPEQIVIRLKDGLGQDRDYMRRNFQIVHHLITGDEEVDPTINPKKWRAWKMPNRDFTLGIVDSRLWRSSQDTAMWDDEGWGHVRELYDRADPTRSLLGEEQFAWLQELIRTDSSRLICLTGLNGLHTVWTGGKNYSKTDEDFPQRDRVAADYAGWVAAGADRVIELLGSRDGVVTVYGDVHNGLIAKNTEHGVIECSFGPIGRSGGRAVITGFGPSMKDYDGRPLEVTALYHKTHANPKLEGHAENEPFYWNFLEMEFDPTTEDPVIGLRVRNMVDGPETAPRGGGALETAASVTGRPVTCRLPDIRTISNADVRFTTLEGRPLRGTRSDGEGRLRMAGLAGPTAGDLVVMTAQRGNRARAKVVELVKL